MQSELDLLIMYVDLLRLARTSKEAYSPRAEFTSERQVDFEGDHPPTADSPPRDHFLTIVKETEKRFRRMNMENLFVSLIHMMPALPGISIHNADLR